MRKTFEKQSTKCLRCPRVTNEPRRGLCYPCYLREFRGSSLPVDAACVTCEIKNPIVLTLKKGTVLCRNCSALSDARCA